MAPSRSTRPIPTWRDDPARVRPMLATPLEREVSESDLENPAMLYEPKLDGIRGLVSIEPAQPSPRVTIWSRNGNDKTHQFPEVVRGLKDFGRRLRVPLMLDGEIVALDAHGEPAGFQRLQGRMHLMGARDIARQAEAQVAAFIAFDILRDGAEDLRPLPLTDRRARLERVFGASGSSSVRLGDFVPSDGRRLYQQAIARGWEGLIVKVADSPYETGRRSRAWQKLKLVKQQEFVIGGWTEPRETRMYFGALLLGAYERPAPAASGRKKAEEPRLLRYIGHSGGGFTHQELGRVFKLLQARATDVCPFAGRPPSNERPHWVRPELVCQVKFSEWTDEGQLRHPVYLGMRDDVDPAQVIVDLPAEASLSASSPSSSSSSSPSATKARAAAKASHDDNVHAGADDGADDNVNDTDGADGADDDARDGVGDAAAAAAAGANASRAATKRRATRGAVSAAPSEGRQAVAPAAAAVSRASTRSQASRADGSAASNRSGKANGPARSGDSAGSGSSATPGNSVTSGRSGKSAGSGKSGAAGKSGDAAKGRGRLAHAEISRPRKGAGRIAATVAEERALLQVVDQLNVLQDARRDGTIVLPDGSSLDVTNLAKVFWPAEKLTKGDALRFYVRVSPWLLPVVEDRPLVMKRFPNGMTAKAFYQQRAPDDPPPGVRVERVEDDGEPDGIMPRLVGGSLTTLLYMTQLAAISQDPWFSRIESMEFADYVALDLDPMPGVPFSQVLDVARWVHEELEALEIPSVPKTSGSSGLHIYIPLSPETTYESGQLLCHIVATMVAMKHGRLATVERQVAKRGRKVYVDYLQNIEGKTLATAYSARASEFAGVSTPLTWEEVHKGVEPQDFTLKTVLPRFERVGDLWAPIRTSPPVDLHGALERLAQNGS